MDTINDNKFSFNYIAMLLIMLADCCMPRRREWCNMEAVGHQRFHGSSGVVCVFYLASTYVKRVQMSMQYPSSLCRLTWVVTHVIGLHVELTILGEYDVALMTF